MTPPPCTDGDDAAAKSIPASGSPPAVPSVQKLLASRLLIGNAGHGKAGSLPRWRRRVQERLGHWVTWWGVLWDPRDLWIGAYWTCPDVSWHQAVDVYVCLLPCLPLKLMLRRNPGRWL